MNSLCRRLVLRGRGRESGILDRLVFDGFQVRYFRLSLGIRVPKETREHILRDINRGAKFSHAIRQVTQPDETPKNSEERKLESPFEPLNLMNPLLRAIKDVGYDKPTEIQKRTIPLGIRGINIVATAETGTGKTAAYALPMLHRLHIIKKRTETSSEKSDASSPSSSPPLSPEESEEIARPLALILCPSRELAEQVMDMIFKYAKYLPDIKIVGIYGALKSTSRQVKELSKGVDIVVSTPGRLITLIKNKKVINVDDKEAKVNKITETEDPQDEEPSHEILDLSQVKVFVLDEADKMLAMGHAPDIKTIFLNLPKPSKRAKADNMQVMMFTATLMGKVMNLLLRFAPRHERIDLNWNLKAPKQVRQVLYYVDSRRKRSLLIYLLKRKSGLLKDNNVLVFCRTRQRAVFLTEALKIAKISAECVHKLQTLETRQSNIEKFRNKQIRVLVSTELMSRGIDIPDLAVVLNFDVPHIPEEYIHRIGRTGRAGKEGTAITFVGKKPILLKMANQVVELDEKRYIRDIETLLEEKIPTSKIPGPWEDVSKSDAPDPREENLKEEKKKAVDVLLKKAKRIADNAARMNNIKKATPMEKESIELLKKKNVELKDFKEGRYEFIVDKLERKRTNKRGLKVPENYDKLVADMENKRQELRETKKEKIREIEQRKQEKLRADEKRQQRIQKLLSSPEYQSIVSKLPSKKPTDEKSNEEGSKQTQNVFVNQKHIKQSQENFESKTQQSRENKPQQPRKKLDRKTQRYRENKPQQSRENFESKTQQYKPQQSRENKPQQPREKLDSKTQQYRENKLQQSRENFESKTQQYKPQQSRENKPQQPRENSESKPQQSRENKPQQPREKLDSKPQQSRENKSQQPREKLDSKTQHRENNKSHQRKFDRIQPEVGQFKKQKETKRP